ncbi:HTH-type transcriptional regulator MhqR [bioreactor metagenome]|uniref:HTH-type transcriptional regulator MhqR n=1 Tax=bioreactor metagenome TaxID=1076179 RepID=A0A645E4M6_9ZZZZ
MESNECINHLMNRAQQTVHQQFRAALTEFGVTPVQYAVLSTLWKEGSLTPSQIAAAVSLDSSTVTGILDRLEQKKLLRRMPDKTDRRVLRISLTEAGSALEAPVMQAVDRCNKAVMTVYSSEEQELLVRLLQRLS